MEVFAFDEGEERGDNETLLRELSEGVHGVRKRSDRKNGNTRTVIGQQDSEQKTAKITHSKVPN